MQNKEKFLDLKMMIIKKAFTLLEMMIVICLIGIASGVVGWRMHRAIQNQQFHSDVICFRNQLMCFQKLAVARQVDFHAVLKKEKGKWVFISVCLEDKIQRVRPLKLHIKEAIIEGKQVEEVQFDFYSTGLVASCEAMTLVGAVDQEVVRLSDCIKGSVALKKYCF